MPNWGEVQNEIVQEAFKWQQEAARANAMANQALDTVRRRYLNKLFEQTRRPVIAYYSGFLSKPERADINDEDKNGFMMAVHGIKPRYNGLDLILHTPGGSIASTQSIVDYLQSLFGRDIRAIIPQVAMSAGTMIACSCKEILMGKESNLGPIDPHINGRAAYQIISEFKRAYEEIQPKNASQRVIDQGKVLVWQPIISQYHPTLLSQCQNAIEWSNRFVEQQLARVMFGPKSDSQKQSAKEKRDAKKKAKGIVKHLTDYSQNKSHARHIHIDECKTIGLNVVELEADGNEELQDLVLTVHHCYMHSLMNSGAYKIIENHKGAAFIKNSMDISRSVIRQPAQPSV